MATLDSVPKPLVVVSSAFVKALQNQLFVTGGSGTRTIDTNAFFIFQTF